MDNYEKVTGGKVLAIPHNSNLSNGLMYELVGPDGGPMTAAYARRRAAREPVSEITQIKGDSESHPFLSPNDEFSGFGTAGWDLGNLTMQAAKKPQDYAGEYIREALKRGLAIEARSLDDNKPRSPIAENVVRNLFFTSFVLPEIFLLFRSMTSGVKARLINPVSSSRVINIMPLALGGLCSIRIMPKTCIT
jgi:hypothetical protein